MVVKRGIGDRIFNASNIIFLALISFITIYPFIYVISSSISSLDAIVKQEIYFLPKGINFDAYKMAFNDKIFLTAYFNTIWYTVVGTFINVILTTSAAYPLSRKSYSIRSQLMLFVAVTMYFSGGLVPEFILVNNLGLYNTRWIMVILGAVNVYNLVITRVFFQSTIPEEISEAAKIDGANDFVIFFKIVLPLSEAMIAVLTLMYAVGHWNEFFKALVYLSDSQLQPMALYMRKLLITGGAAANEEAGMAFYDEFKVLAVNQQFKFASIIITMLPIMCFYPFLQKYFVKGMMIGAVKE
jgi:putative aldouronate transport system permease protein